MNKFLTLFIGGMVLVAMAGCTSQDNAFAPPNLQRPAAALSSIDADDVLVTESDMKDRPYNVLGRVLAYAQPANISPNPSHGDIDEELRSQAAQIGAEAVILVKYHNESTGHNDNKKILAEGLAVTFKN